MWQSEALLMLSRCPVCMPTGIPKNNQKVAASTEPDQMPESIQQRSFDVLRVLTSSLRPNSPTLLNLVHFFSIKKILF